MAARKRNPQKILEDRARIATLHLKGWSQYAIASEMGMTRSLVRYDIEAIEKEWKESAVVDFDAAKQRELRKIDLIEQEMWIAWENSKSPRESNTSRQRKRELQFAATQTNGQAAAEQVIPLDRTSEVNKRTEQRDPAEAFMARIAWCVEMRCKILGLIAPQVLQHTGTVTQINEIYYEQTPDAPNGRLLIIGGQADAAPALANGQVTIGREDDDVLEQELG